MYVNYKKIMTIEQKNQLANMEFKLKGDKLTEVNGKLYIYSNLEYNKGIEILEPEELFFRLKRWVENKDTSLFGKKLEYVDKH